MATLNHPADLRYSKSHEWVRVDGNEATIGITDYAQNELGDVVSLELPWEDAGAGEVRAGRHFGDIDSVKSTSELFAPISGRIVRINSALHDAPEVINSEPYTGGWMLVVAMSDPAEVEQLMTGDQYEQFLQTQGH